MLMPIVFFQLPANNQPSNPSSVFPILIISLLLIISHGSIAAAAAAAAHNKITTIGAIVDDNSRVGKEQKVAMEIAVQNFNNTSTHHKLSLHVQNSGRDPLQAAYAADGLIKEKQVQVIVGMERWHQAALVADVGSRAQVPVLSLAAAAVTPPLPALRWPFLVQIATNASQQVNCIAAIIRSYNWKRVIAIYEDDIYSGDSGMVALLSEALQSSGSEIEYRLVFPPFSSLSDPEGFVLKEVSALLKKQSRVFIALKSSVSLATHLFREAKQLGLMERDSVWIITDTVSSVLESVNNNSVISSMQGVLGIETYFSKDGASFLDFKGKFQKKFHLEYPDEENSRPGIHALRAYDSINTIAQALQEIGTGNNMTSKMLLENILSTNFIGLSGDVVFANGKLSQLSAFRIVNVIGKTYNELGFWSSEVGFSEEFTDIISGSEDMKMVFDSVTWPGKLKAVPKGWAMRTMQIVVPGTPIFEKFLKVDWNSENSPSITPMPTGFCIDVFLKALNYSDYRPLYKFHPVNDTYDNLVKSVFNKTYDAVVGDLTIVANRSEYVEFTQPYTESGLLMIVPVKSDKDKAWIFVKPFSMEVWLVTGIVMIYTASILWFLEHHSNPEFGGPRKNQLSTTLWFTFSSLFFAHKEQIKRNYTKVLVVVWLLVVFVVTTSYQASLTSILTVKRLDPNVTDVDWLRRNNAKVGCDGNSFATSYLQDVLQFKEENIRPIDSEHKYVDEFESGNITAAFLEVPSAKVFLEQYCNKYTSAGPVYRLGGWGFAFQKGSPIANDLSKAILTISENGELNELEEDLLNVPSTSSCSNADSTTNADRLSLQNFWGLYVISVATSTICFLLFLVSLWKKYRCQNQENQDNTSPITNSSIWRKVVRFVQYCFHGGGGIASAAVGSAPTPSRERSKNGHEWELVSPSEIPEHLEARPPTEIEIPIRTG